jgi:hypothetical protein
MGSLVVESATKAGAFSAAADVLDQDRTEVGYLPPDLAGISIFDTGYNDEAATVTAAPWRPCRNGRSIERGLSYCVGVAMSSI